MKRWFYVCRQCRFVQFHRLIYCPKCPGMLDQQIELEVGNYGFSNPDNKRLIELQTDLATKLKEQGYTFEPGLSW